MHNKRVILPLLLMLAVVPLNVLFAFMPQKSATAAKLALPSFSHIFVIVLENTEYSDIIGNPSAPYFNNLASTYGLATQYYAIRHPSLPNYMALTGGSTFGIKSDCQSCFKKATNITDQIETSGRTWKAYMENMPSPCYLGDSPDGLYVQKHDPFMYYNDIRLNTARCTVDVVPFTQFSTDLSNNTLPNFAWITPNMCNDAHDCPLSVADTWLSQVVPTILNSSAYQNNGLLLITTDEGTTNLGCCMLAKGGHVATLVISPLGISGYQSTIQETHYSLLRTIEDSWGLPPLRNARTSSAMSEFFP
jgi:phosphatidylinositol-3-phosphatase